MAIYLDANIVWPWRTFAELDRLALSIVASQVEQEVVIPEIAAIEAEEGYRRSLLTAIANHDTAFSDLQRNFGDRFEIDLEPTPDPQRSVEQWREGLDELGQVQALDPRDAVSALKREITGDAPAKERDAGWTSGGSRDAAIWLSVVRHHGDSDEEGHFISANLRDFADKDGTLKMALQGDFAAAGQPLRYYPGIAEFLGRLGTETKASAIDLSELKRKAEPALRVALEAGNKVTSAVWEAAGTTHRYRTLLTAAEPSEITRTRRYERGDENITLIDSKWQVVVDCLFQDRGTSSPDHWGRIPNVELTGSVQLYLADGSDGNRAEIITSQWRSDTWAFLDEDGRPTILTGLS